MWKDAKWIGVPAEEIRKKEIYQGDMNGRFAYFRYEFELPETGSMTIDISANSRYRLWINETPILSGSCRSDRYRHFYETVEVSSYLRTGKNVFAAAVLLCDSGYVSAQGDRRTPLISVASLPAGHRLAVEGRVTSRTGEVLAEVTTGKAPWKVWLDNSFFLISETLVNDNMGAITEHVDFGRMPWDWKKKDYCADAWPEAFSIETAGENPVMQAVGFVQKFPLTQRPIPLLYEKEETLSWEEEGLQDSDKVIIPPHTKKEFFFNGKYLFNAYMVYHFSGGKGAKVSFTCFERFFHADKNIKRDDAVQGTPYLDGQTDTLVLNGEDVRYEPFWYRTMRFLKIVVETREEEAGMYCPVVRKTGYPLQPESRVSSSAEWVGRLWEMCVRTLQGCMMETYMDCPFWEQMQYPMDTRLQALFTYVCSKDTLLAQKALEDFHSSMIPCGLIQGKAPSGSIQVISTFSLYYIYMIAEFYDRTGAVSVIRSYRADMDRVLEYYDSKIGTSGLVEELDYWAFVDWQPDWKEYMGKPAAMQFGPSTVINLMYAYALEEAGRLNCAAGRCGIAEEYTKRRETILERVQELCWDAEYRMYREGPAFGQFYQFTQSWAVLNGMLEGEEAAALMERSFDADKVLQCNFSTSYELFRACKKAGRYGLTVRQMQRWIDLIGENCTTCPETPQDSRSECHAWSALPMYEMICSFAGIRTDIQKDAVLEICPHMEYLPDITGDVVTDRGTIHFDYRKEEGHTSYELWIPDGITGTFRYPDGTTQHLETGKNVMVYAYGLY
ncbi:MAG: hypothetical protein NC489_40590 [Ruminococcus flavefaciens]|nr:hypothetical protein [Ruminococcus flavefaciens]